MLKPGQYDCNSDTAGNEFYIRIDLENYTSESKKLSVKCKVLVTIVGSKIQSIIP